MALVVEASLVGAAEIARLLGVSKRGIYRLADDGLPHYRVGGQLRFDADEVLTFLRRGESE